MNKIDLTNAFFEGGGAILCWLNVVRLRRDREIKGVLWPVQIFWSTWGLWNLAYYNAVGHPWSLWAGAVLVSGNITWTAHAFYYARKAKRYERHLRAIDEVAAEIEFCSRPTRSPRSTTSRDVRVSVRRVLQTRS